MMQSIRKSLDEQDLQAGAAWLAKVLGVEVLVTDDLAAYRDVARQSRGEQWTRS